MHARRNNSFNDFLRDAVRNNDAESLKKALSDLNVRERALALCRPIFEGKPLLHYSLDVAKGGISNIEAVQEIVNFSTADTLNVPDHEGNYPHTLALEAGTEYAQILLSSRDVDWGISVDNEGNIPFAFAVKNIQFDGNSELFALILTRYPDAFDRVNEVGKNVLHIACESDDPELLRFCIEKSISRSKDLKLLLEQKNGLGETPLHTAYAIQDNSETSDVLKRYIKEDSGRVNVDLSLKDLEKRSVVSTALQVGNRHILDICKGDFKSEVEGVVSLLEYSDVNLLNNYLDSFSPEHKDKLIKHSVKELLDHPQRFIKILSLEDEDISNKLIRDDQWRQHLAERASEYMACWLLSGSDRVDELIPARLPMGRRVSNITGNEEPCQSDAIRSIVSSAICISGGDKNALDRLFNSRKLPKDLQLEARQVLGLINEKTQADSLKLILDKSSPAALEEACFKLAEKDRNGSSIIEKICDSYPSDKICSLLTSAMRNDIYPNMPFHGSTALKTEMSHIGIKHAREGNYAKVEGIVNALPHVLYAVDQETNQSILEVAADAGHTPLVRLLIDQHKKVLEGEVSQNPLHQSCSAISSIAEVAKVSAKDATQMINEYHLSSDDRQISHIDAKRILSNSHPTDRRLLVQTLEEIYPDISRFSFLKHHSASEKSVTAAEKYKQPSTPKQTSENKSHKLGITGSATEALRDFGSLKSLASSIKNTIGDATGFKEKVLDSLNNERDFSKTSHKSGSGHNVFTIAAILGTPEQYDALLKRYSDKSSFGASSKASSHGTPLQCAVKAGNSSMVRHLLEKCTAEEIKKTGEDKENLLHTIIGSSQLDLLRFLPSASSSSKGSAYSKNVLKAFLEKNAQNKTPLDLALTSGEQHTSALLSFVNSSLKDSEIERLIGSENIVQTAIERGNTLLLGWIFDAESRYNSLVLPSGKKKGKSSSKQLHVLGNRNYELSLLRDACKSQNPDIAPFFLRKINERIQSSSIDEEEASANISKLSKQTLAYLVAHNTYHPAVYSNLMELSQAQDPTKNEFFLKGAWQHDNADLIKHIPYQDVAQHLDKSALIKSGKDNLLLYCLENSTPTELENIGQDLKKALAQSKDKMQKSGEFYSAWCADAALPPVLSEATLHSAISSGDLNRVKDLIAMDPTLIAKSQASTAETRDDSSLLPYDFAVKKWANSKKHSGLVKYLAKQSIDFALSEATADRGIAGVRADQLISQEDWDNFSHTVTKILVTRGADLELDSMQLANLNAHLRSSTSKLFEKSDAASPSLLRTSLSSPKNYLVTSALLKHYLVHQEQLQQELNPSEMEKIERQVANEINKVENGYSLLHLAALNGSYDTLNTLLALGGDKNILTPHGQNIAHLTAKSGMLTPTDGELVFEKLVRENPELNTKDKGGKGLLYYAASCVHPERTVAMLERIIASATGDTEDKSADRVILDANLKKYSKNSKKRDEFIKNELNRIDKSRPDNVLSDFLDEHFRDDSMTAAEHALNQLRKITSSSQKSDKKLLPHALERTSERSFTEINPIAGAVPYMSKGRHLLLEQQKELFSICSQEALSGQGRDILRYVPIEAFTSRNPDYGFSPLDAAIERENIPFIREILENRAKELPLNITNQNGDNLVIQLGKMLENPRVLQDKEFLELYENLLDKSGCSTRSDSGIKAQYVLRNIGGVAGAELRNIADRAERREVEIGKKFSDAINKVTEEASPNAVQHLSTLTRVYSNYARNTANPFAALLSNILLDNNTETNGVSEDARRAITAFLRDHTLRDTLKNVDSQGNNPLQSALQDLVKEVGSSEIGTQRATALLEVCSDVASVLEKQDKNLLEEVFLKHKNYNGENLIESLTGVSPSFDIFRTLETKLTPEKVSESSDLNTILARSANQAPLQNHICKNYSVFPIGDSDYRGKSRIHKAVVSGDHDAFMSVMVTGGNINLLDQDGNTPLHSLLIHMLRNKDNGNIKPGHIETLKTLVSHGAPLHLKNKEGFTVCDLAKSIEHLPSPVKRSMFSLSRKKEDSCVDLVAQAHLQYHDLKEDVKKKVESNITWPSGTEKSTLSFCDLSGSKVAVKIGAGGVLTSSKLLHSKVFQENALSSANFDFGDGKDLGSVEKVGNKRNYTVQKGTIKLELSWKPSEGKTQKVQVDVLADGTVKVNDESIRECGAQGEKLNFNNCQVYIGGYSLAEALQRGRWREANQEIETSAPDIDPDGRKHGLDRSPSPGNDERRELGAAALDDSIPYTSIPDSDGTALPSHAPSSRTSSISSTTDGGDEDYPSASAGRGQVITVAAEVYDEEGRPIPASRGRDLGPHGGDGGAEGMTPERPVPAARGRDLGPRGDDSGTRRTPQEPDAPDSGDDDYPSARAGRGQVITVAAEVYDEEGRPIPASRGRDLGPHGGDGGAEGMTPERPVPAARGRDLGPRGGDSGTRRTPQEPDAPDSGDEDYPSASAGRGQVITVAAEVYDEEGRPIPASRGRDLGPHGGDGGTRRTPQEPDAPTPEDLAARDGGASGRTTPTITFPDSEDSDVAEHRLAMPIRGFVPLPTILSESEDDSSSLGTQYNSDSDDDFFSTRNTLTSPSPSLEDISVLAMEAQNLRDLSSDIAVTPAPIDLAVRDGTGDRGIAVPIDGVPAPDGSAESRKPQEPATVLAPEDLAARDGAGDRGIAVPIDGVPAQDGSAESRTPREPAAPAPEDLAARDGAGDRGIAVPIDGVPAQDGSAESRTPREPAAPAPEDLAARDGAGDRGIAVPIDGVPAQDGSAESRTPGEPAADPAPIDLAAGDGGGDRGRTTPIDGVPAQDGGAEGITPRGPAADPAPIDLAARDGGAEGIATPIDGRPGQDGAESRTPRGPAADPAPIDLAAGDGGGDRGRTTPIDGVPAQDGGAEGITPRGPAADPAPIDLAARDGGAEGIATPIDGRPGQDGAESRTPRGPAADPAPIDLAAGDGGGDRGRTTPIDGVPAQDGGAEGITPRGPAAAIAPEDLAARDGAGDRGIAAPIDGVPAQDGSAESRTPGEPAADLASTDIAARDGAGDRGIAAPIDGVPGPDAGTEGRTSRGPAAPAPEDLAARGGGGDRGIAVPIDGVPAQDGGAEGIAAPIDGVPAQDGSAESRTPREPAADPASTDIAARDGAARGITAPIDGVPGPDAGTEGRTSRGPAAPAPEDLAARGGGGDRGRTTPIDGRPGQDGAESRTPGEPAADLASTDIAARDGAGDRGIAVPIDGVPAQDGGVESRTPQEPAADPAPIDLAAGDGTGDRGIAVPIDGVPAQDGSAESRTPGEPAAAIAPEDLAARDGAGDRGIAVPIDGVPAQDGGAEGIAAPIDGVPAQDGSAESRTPREPAADPASTDIAARDGAARGITAPIDGVPGQQDGSVESKTPRGPAADPASTDIAARIAARDGAARGITAPIDGVPGPDAGTEGRTSRGPAAPAPEDLAARGGGGDRGRTTPIDGRPGQDGAESRTPGEPAADLASTDIAARDGAGDRGIAVPIDGVPAQDGGVESRTPQEPAADPAPIDLAAGDGTGDRGIAVPIDGVPAQDGSAESRTPGEPAAAIAPEDLAARDGTGDREISAPIDRGSGTDAGVAPIIDGVPAQDGSAESRTSRGPDDAPAPTDIVARDGGAEGIAALIDGRPGQDGAESESRTSRGPDDAPAPTDIVARDGGAEGIAALIDGRPGQDGAESESRTSRGPAALDRGDLAAGQESVNLQKWHSMLRMGMHAGCQFAMDLGNENDIGAIAQKCAEKYSALAKREDLQDPATIRAALKKEMRDVLGEFGIPNIPLNHGKLTIKNGNVQGLEGTTHFSSPYGFGERIDSMIQAALRDVNEVARRANLNCEIQPNILSLPRIALAVDNMKDPRKGLVLPSLGGNDDTPIPYRDAIKFLEGVSNLAMLEEKPKIVKESSISPDDPEARKVSRLIRYFSALANEEEGTTAASIPHGTVQQNMLSDDDIEALRSTIEVIDAERELVSQRQQMLHADLEAVLTEPVQESTHSYDSIASTKSDTSSIESADGASGDASYKPHFAAPAVHGEATSVGDDTPEVFTASVEAHYILSDERHPKIVDSMLKMFSESENDLSRCGMYSWAMLNKFSSIAGLNLAMHAKQPENVISAARYVFDSYKKAVDSKRSDEVTQEILKDRIPRALKRNYIDYVDVGDGTFNIENGAITGAPVDKVPAHFISPLGFGPYLDRVIIESAEDIAKIAKRSTLNHSLSELTKESLPALPVAVHQVTQDGGEYSRRFFHTPGDDSPIPQECGERILTHIGNICIAKSGTYNITPSDRPERRVIIDGLAKDKIRAFNARADIDEQRESAIRQRQDANIARGAFSTASMPARAPMPEPAPDSEAAAMMDFYYATGARPKIRSTTTKSSRSTSTRVVDTDVSRVAEEVKKCADGMKGVKGGDDSSTIATPGHSPIVSQVSHQEGRSNR